MSTPSSRDLSRDEKLAAIRANNARSGRQKKLLAALGALVVAALIAVGVMAAVSSNSKSDSQGATPPSAASVAKILKIPDSVYNTVGLGSANGVIHTLPGAKPLTHNGKPRVIFYGAEYCPFCAMQRWSFIAALSRFGTWSGLSGLVSGEAGSPIPTADFVHAKFSSPYLDLTTYELMDQKRNPLQKASASDEALMNKYDVFQYFPELGDSSGNGSIPFILYGGTAGSSGASYSDANEMVSAKGDKIADALTNPSASTTKGIVGAANLISAQVCKMDGGKPASVCNSAGVKAAAKALK